MPRSRHPVLYYIVRALPARQPGWNIARPQLLLRQQPSCSSASKSGSWRSVSSPNCDRKALTGVPIITLNRGSLLREMRGPDSTVIDRLDLESERKCKSKTASPASLSPSRKYSQSSRRASNVASRNQEPNSAGPAPLSRRQAARAASTKSAASRLASSARPACAQPIVYQARSRGPSRRPRLAICHVSCLVSGAVLTVGKPPDRPITPNGAIEIARARFYWSENLTFTPRRQGIFNITDSPRHPGILRARQSALRRAVLPAQGAAGWNGGQGAPNLAVCVRSSATSTKPS